MPVHQPIYGRLKQVARAEEISYYSEIAPLAGLNMEHANDRNQIAQILDDINWHEREAGRPMLSAVVILKELNLPGQGFFSLARGFGMFHGEDQYAFWTDELRKVHQYWRTASQETGTDQA